MAKGVGGQMALGAAALSSAKDWYAAVLTAAGLDPRVCPVCGPTSGYEWNGVIICCGCPTTPRAEIVMTARRAAVPEPGWDDPYLWIVDGVGNLVAGYQNGRRYPIWNFVTLISVTMRPEDFPPLPEGLTVVYPDWWPSQALAEYDAQLSAKVEGDLAGVYAEAAQLGLKLCPECGSTAHAKSWDKCYAPDQHPAVRLSWARKVVDEARQKFGAENQRRQKIQAKAAECQGLKEVKVEILRGGSGRWQLGMHGLRLAAGHVPKQAPFEEVCRRQITRAAREHLAPDWPGLRGGGLCDLAVPGWVLADLIKKALG